MQGVLLTVFIRHRLDLEIWYDSIDTLFFVNAYDKATIELVLLTLLIYRHVLMKWSMSSHSRVSGISLALPKYYWLNMLMDRVWWWCWIDGLSVMSESLTSLDTLRYLYHRWFDHCYGNVAMDRTWLRLLY